MAELRQVMTRLATVMTNLAQTVADHENRLGGTEGNRPVKPGESVITDSLRRVQMFDQRAARVREIELLATSHSATASTLPIPSP